MKHQGTRAKLRDHLFEYYSINSFLVPLLKILTGTTKCDSLAELTDCSLTYLNCLISTITSHYPAFPPAVQYLKALQALLFKS